MKKYEKMVKLNSLESRGKVRIAQNEIKRAMESEETIIISVLARRTGLSRAFFYNNKEVRASLNEAKSLQSGRVLESKRKEILDGALEAKNKILTKQNIKLAEEIEGLKKDLQRMKRIIEQMELEFIDKL